MNTQSTSQTPKTAGSYCRFGAETLLKLLEGTDHLIFGVLENKDIEYVHKTRVASRRLRAALPLFRFCYSRKQYRTWTTEIKKVTRLLSTARDLDVQIAFIEQYTKKLTSEKEKAALNVILRSHRARRRNAQTAVATGLQELQAAGVLNQIRECCHQIIMEQKNQTFKPNEVLDSAHWHASFRIDDFLSMKKYVHQERKGLQHHQMRIYAKKLRYTMECFAPLYKDKLEKEIKTIKDFQDVLGEMHDCEVWLEFIPQFRQKIRRSKTPRKYSSETLRNFTVYLVEQRKKFYSQFTTLWENSKQTGFFEQLRKKTGTEFIAQKLKQVKKALRNPEVKIAVLSDVHANVQALEAVIEDSEKRGATAFLNAGDSIGFGASPNEAVQLLCEKNMLSILGNFDLEVLEGISGDKAQKKLAYRFAQRKLSKAAESYLSGLPRDLHLEAAGRKLLVTHGAPGEISVHVFPDAPEEKFLKWIKKAKADLVIMGHTHQQFWRQVNGVNFVNPGSVGRPGDGNPEAAYALLTFNPFNAELIRLDYDVKEAAEVMRKEGLPESYAQMLLNGVALESILEKDRSLRARSLKKQEQTVKACEEFTTKSWPDTEHFRQVTDLALALFDALKDEHKLGRQERFWLRCAAVLHDVGLSKPSGKHHKKSAQIILNTPQLPLPSKERRIIACIARYHRKALPKPKHYLLRCFGSKTINKICVLSAMLRVADGLDRAHQSDVKISAVKAGAKKISVEYTSPSADTLGEEAFDKKKDLFERVFSKKLVLVWSQTKTVNE